MAVPAAVHPYRDGIMVRVDSQLSFATISAHLVICKPDNFVCWCGRIGSAAPYRRWL